jgi:hypothetical protein
MQPLRKIRRRAIGVVTSIGVLAGVWVAAGAPIYQGF